MWIYGASDNSSECKHVVSLIRITPALPGDVGYRHTYLLWPTHTRNRDACVAKSYACKCVISHGYVSTVSEGRMHREALRYENNARPAGHVCKSRQILSLPVSRAYTDISRICAKTTGDAYYIRVPVALISIPREKEVSPRHGYTIGQITALWLFSHFFSPRTKSARIKIINDTRAFRFASLTFLWNFYLRPNLVSR